MTPAVAARYEATEAFARRLDETDPVARYRDRFHLPPGADGEPQVYFCGNSLGLLPRTARAAVEQELDDWATLAVDAHLKGATPWYSYHEIFTDPCGRLVGARPGAGEVVMMNSLTVNIHLMLVSFLRTTATRNKVVMEHPAFPSDLYAVRTHLRTRGLDPDESIIQLRPRAAEYTIRTQDIETLLDERGSEIALVWLPGVNYFTGQVFDMARITAAAKRQGCIVGFDLAHAAGNVTMKLHDWDVDFACWCTYKYLNAGPGSVGGCFIHERHGRNPDLQRYAGWWGDDPDTRFQMHLKREFIAQPGAAGWQVSNPPILSMAPLKASLEIFDEIGIEALREKSRTLTGYLRWLLGQGSNDRFEIITPPQPQAQGCQLSILVHDEPARRYEALVSHEMICDFREPNVIRVAPAPLYNTFHEVWRFSRVLLGQL